MVEKLETMEKNKKESNNKRIFIYIIWFVAILNFLIGPSLINWITSQQFTQEPNQSLMDNITTEGKSYVDGLDDSPENGLNFMKIRGWAFLTSDKQKSPDDYQRSLILLSEKSHYTLDIKRIEREGVQSHFSDLGMNLVGSGFQAVFDNNSILPGLYKIGVLFVNESGQELFLLTNKYIEKTSNTTVLK
jgi:hypothetical protein